MSEIENASEAEILEKAEALRAETIHAFISALFKNRQSKAQEMPISAIPAE